MERRKEIIALLLLIVIIALFYAKILNGFFVQDEWYSFGWFLLHRDLNWLGLVKFFLAPDIGHYNPLANFITSLLFFRWGVDYPKFAVVGIVLHILVSLALYFLARIIFKGNRLLAFFTALIFGLLASPYQGISWVVTNIATLSSSFLGIISAILFFTFLNQKKNHYLFWSLILLLISLLFKEITFGLLPLFLTLCLIKTAGVVKKRGVLLVSAFTAGYIIFRGFMFLLPHQSLNSPINQTRPAEVVIYNFLTLPIKSLSQSLISADFEKKAAFGFAELFLRNISGIPGSPEFEKFAVERVMEVISIVLGLTLFITGIRLRIYFGLGWVLVNSLIFSISPGVYRPIFVVDSRNLYFVSIGAVIFLTSLLKVFFFGKTKAFLIVAFGVLVLNAYWLNSNLSGFAEVGATRKYILEKIAQSYPNLPKKTIFYTESDSSYYGLPDDEKILPFQSGLGQTLLIYYSQKDEFPKDFYPGDFLWDIKSQGYEEHGGRGFGFFRNLRLLKETLREYNLPQDSVIAFSWSALTEEFKEITPEIRKEL